jgi:hypothetical protein
MVFTHKIDFYSKIKNYLKKTLAPLIKRSIKKVEYVLRPRNMCLGGIFTHNVYIFFLEKGV